MFVGHFATGVAIKAFAPDVKALPIMGGVALIDVIDGLFILSRINHVEANLDAGPYLLFDLVFIDWDHSLLMAILWALLWTLLFLRRGRRTALVAGAAVLSHWLCDLPLHNADLALFPYSQEELGFGLWGSMVLGSWILEGAFSLVLVAIAWWKFRERRVSILVPAIILAAMFVYLSPWLTPMRRIAVLDADAATTRLGIGVLLGFLITALLFTWLLDRGERRASLLRKAEIVPRH